MKRDESVLVLSTYPINQPIHGGQKRTQAIVQTYKKVFKSVEYVAIFNPHAYPGYSERSGSDLPITKETLKKIAQKPILEDLIIGRDCYDDALLRKTLQNTIIKHNPDFIHFEQPYLYLGIKKILQEVSPSTKIIFGSQNIEHKMKKDIYASHKDMLTDVEINQELKAILDLEKEISREAVLTAVVSENDLKEHKKMGAKNIVLAPNGVSDIRASQKSITKWQEKLKSMGVDKTILFTGSAHPPNWTGFLNMVGSRVGFLPINARLLIVGDVGDALEYAISEKDNLGSSFWLRAINCRRVSDDDLAALLKVCDAIILPITEGGGSNLKTAEALLSGKPIVATSHAFRAYEEYLNLSNVSIEDGSDDFRQKMVDVINTPPQETTDREQAMSREVLWPSRLKEFEERISKI